MFYQTVVPKDEMEIMQEKQHAVGYHLVEISVVETWLR